MRLFAGAETGTLGRTMEALESVLAGVPFLERLRADEVARVAARFELVTLPPGGRP